MINALYERSAEFSFFILENVKDSAQQRIRARNVSFNWNYNFLTTGLLFILRVTKHGKVRNARASDFFLCGKPVDEYEQVRVFIWLRQSGIISMKFSRLSIVFFFRFKMFSCLWNVDQVSLDLHWRPFYSSRSSVQNSGNFFLVKRMLY